MSDSIDLSNAQYGQPPQAKVPYAMRITYAGTKLNKAKDGLYLSISASIVTPGESLGFGLNFPPYAAMLAKKGDPAKTAEYLGRTVNFLATLMDKDPDEVKSDLPSRAGAKTDLLRELTGAVFQAEARLGQGYTNSEGRKFDPRWEIDPDTVAPLDFDINEILTAEGDISEMFSFEETEAF